MTSAYLHKKPRELDTALKTRGMSRADLGLDASDQSDAAFESSAEDPIVSGKKCGAASWTILGLTALLVCLGFTMSTILPSAQVATDPDPEMLDITPAAGPPPNSSLQQGSLESDPIFQELPDAGILQPLED